MGPAAFVMLVLCSAAFAAEDAARGSLHADVAKLIDAGAKRTPAGLSAAKSQHAQLKRKFPKDERVDYAYAIVLLNQRKLTEARPLLVAHLRARPDDLPARRAKIWLEVQDAKYAEALNDVAALGRQYATSPAEAAEDWQTTARFLGTTFAYLDRMRPERVNAELKTKCRKDLLAQLGERYVSAFDEGREAFAERLREQEAALKAKHDVRAATAADRVKLNQSELGDARDTLVSEQSAADAVAEKLRESERELSVTRQRLSSLNQDRTQLTAQIVTLQAQLATLGVSIVDNRTPNANLNNNNGGNAAFLNAMAQTLNLPAGQTVVLSPATTNSTGTRATNSVAGSGDPRWAQGLAIGQALARLNKLAFDVDRQMLALNARANELANNGQQDAARLEQSDAVAQKAAKRAHNLEKKMKRDEAVAAKARPAAATPQVASFSNYAPFPFNEEKERVLSWFAP